MLELDELSKRYGETVALDRLGFAVDEGQAFGFVGPNGAGKTTAMRIVIGVLAADAGEVRWRGAPLDAETRRRFGYMPEERGLYPKMAVGQQLAYLGELHGMSDPRARESAALWMKRLGIAERADDKVEELSLGNQQRVQLGTALVHEPEALILDEPFSGLDPVGVDVLSEVLLGVARERGVPVIFSSHQLELVERLCDAVAIIRAGRLVATGGVAELRAERAGRRWRLEVDGAPGTPAWAARVAGATPLGNDVYELAEDTDPQGLLDAARAAGPVTRFGPEVPTLAELFRDVIGRDSEREAAR
ncbi:MAG: ATP-binding cassette domain-containing protein [Solirubrobacterales bacterium]|nr:ATP-binding cassette domain-containing protein [Solirubrobacterales bacterium]